ncbi:hypothetical protein LTR37_012226 [Vermiconidia calcicola]|uniref:Uncharacterized protein n=1 Tax=Vermiconidia calcicola TaxID=1690605 RepID=A0ACC3MZR5_9PEZI|nr:hypothetical protein LTR37_012226 [Vermiconidia calcicola]
MEDREPSVDDVRKWNSTFYPESLAESSDKIRLLHIHAGEFAAPIQCSLSTETLQTPPELTYDALSYCWGDKPHSSPISVNGRADFMVSANLLAALQRMRYSDATHTVWVDYLCINQSDLAERGQQVELMGRIYENAQVVLCWLGPCGSTPSGHEELEFCDDHRLLKISEDDLPEARVQECSLAKDATFLVGPHQYSLKEFRLGTGSYMNSLPTFGRAHEDATDIFFELITREALRQDSLRNRNGGESVSGGSPLIRALENTASAVATDARDKVYGVMSIFATHNLTSRMRADYTKSVEDVFVEAACVIVEEIQDLNFILSAWPKLGQQRYTWLPDFSKPQTVRAVNNYSPNTRAIRRNKRWRQLSLDVGTQPLFQRDGSNLYVEGFNTDKVVATVKGFNTAAGLSVETHLDGCKGSTSQQSLPFEWSTDDPGHQSATARLLSKVVDDVRAEAERKGKQDPYNLDTSHALGRTVCFEDPAEMERPICDTTGEFQDYESSEEYARDVWENLYQRCFFVTAGGSIGIGGQDIETLDEIAIIRGINMPIVWRTVAPDAQYRYISEAFIHGIMYGEVNDVARLHALELQQFVIV